MRLLSGLVLTLVAFVAAATASAQPARDLAPGSGVMELRNGSGTVLVSFSQGALLGNLANGSLRVKSKSTIEPNIIVWGADRTVRINNRTTLYIGDTLRFRVDGRQLRIRLKGARMACSMVGSGLVTLRGRGRYSHDFKPFRRWPAKFRTIRLGTQPVPLTRRPDASAP